MSRKKSDLRSAPGANMAGASSRSRRKTSTSACLTPVLRPWQIARRSTCSRAGLPQDRSIARETVPGGKHRSSAVRNASTSPTSHRPCSAPNSRRNSVKRASISCFLAGHPAGRFVVRARVGDAAAENIARPHPAAPPWWSSTQDRFRQSAHHAATPDLS